MCRLQLGNQIDLFGFLNLYLVNNLPRFGNLETGLLSTSLNEITTNATDDKKSGNNTTPNVDELPPIR